MVRINYLNHKLQNQQESTPEKTFQTPVLIPVGTVNTVDTGIRYSMTVIFLLFHWYP